MLSLIEFVVGTLGCKLPSVVAGLTLSWRCWSQEKVTNVDLEGELIKIIYRYRLI